MLNSMLLPTATRLRSHSTLKVVPSKKQEQSVLVLFSLGFVGESYLNSQYQSKKNMGLPHKFFHFFLNTRQERTSGLSHCPLLIYNKLGLDK